jgi:hypothetical protein
MQTSRATLKAATAATASEAELKKEKITGRFNTKRRVLRAAGQKKAKISE